MGEALAHHYPRAHRPETDVNQRTVENQPRDFLGSAPSSWRWCRPSTSGPRISCSGLPPEDAIAALPAFLPDPPLTQLVYLFFLLLANSLLFLGPFYILSRIGKVMNQPGTMPASC